ncbi:hypothetical protein B0I35DRAFT_446976 [Stachybotrys elegans]|uniref:Uncharacterized protein n=1 Tax=Stachybotrys elegans TaxID=80388 RepID=A0A8K0WIX1_9HYPO|nr:hypothetical protein B0I35DRAFT_446976 [Stachybotrys elegans]
MGLPATQKEPPFLARVSTGNKLPFTDPVRSDAEHSVSHTEAQTAAKMGTQNGVQGQSRELSDPTDLCPIYIDAKYWSCETFRPRENIPDFLARDLSVRRLDDIYDALWWAGRQAPPRPLHRLKMLGRKITVAEQADLHLVWSAESFFVKPLPGFLLDYSFWKQHICKDEHSQETYESARGFVLSYVWLIRHRSDFEIAKNEWLLPDDLTWPKWKEFVHSVWDHFGDLNNPHSISKRYRYGELRISRLDQICRLSPKSSFNLRVQGYLYSYSSYGGFFRREFAWLIVAFAYLSIVLTAMQVGLTTAQLRDNGGFNRASYGFAVTSIMLPAIVSAIGLGLYVGLWAYHVSTTISAWLGGRTSEKYSSNNNSASG